MLPAYKKSHTPVSCDTILSFLLCFTFLSGCGDPQFFHFICVFHFFQGVGLQFFHFFQGPHFFHFYIKFHWEIFPKKEITKIGNR